MTTDTARNAGPTPTGAVRSVLIHDQRAAAREAITHAVTAAIPSVAHITHITCVADASDLATTFAGTPADLVFIGLHDATAGTVHAVELFLQRHPSASVIVLGGVDDTPVLAAAVAHGAQGLMLWPPWYGRTPVRGFPVGARGDVPGLTRIQQAVLQGMSQGRSKPRDRRHIRRHRRHGQITRRPAVPHTRCPRPSTRRRTGPTPPTGALTPGAR